MGNDQKLRCSSCIVIEPHKFKICHSFYMVITLHNLKIQLSLLLLSHPTTSKFYQPTNWNFFWVSSPTCFVFLEIGRNYVPVIIAIISNITLLVSHNVICFGYYMPMSHGMIKKAPPTVSHTPPPYQVFTNIVCCFARNTLSTFLCSDQIIAKIMHF